MRLALTIKIVLAFVVFNSPLLFCQEIENINTDRPDQGDATFVVPARKIQVENGIYADSSIKMNNFLLRCGTGLKSELRIVIDAVNTNALSGLLPFGLSMKRSIREQHKWIPAITLVGYYYFGASGSKNFKRNTNNYSVILAFQNDLNEKWGLSYNIGTTEFKKNTLYTFSLSYTPTKKINLFSEIFGRFYANNQSTHGFDCGILYFLRPNMQLDFAAGIPLTNNHEISKYLTFGYSAILSY
jgi:hypothetical protein